MFRLNDQPIGNVTVEEKKEICKDLQILWEILAAQTCHNPSLFPYAEDVSRTSVLLLDLENVLSGQHKPYKPEKYVNDVIVSIGNTIGHAMGVLHKEFCDGVVRRFVPPGSFTEEKTLALSDYRTIKQLKVALLSHRKSLLRAFSPA